MVREGKEEVLYTAATYYSQHLVFTLTAPPQPPKHCMELSAMEATH